MAIMHIGGSIELEWLPELERAAAADRPVDITGAPLQVTRDWLLASIRAGCLTIQNDSAGGLVCLEDLCRRLQLPFDLLLPAIPPDSDYTLLWYRPGSEDLQLVTDASGDPLVPIGVLEEMVMILDTRGARALRDECAGLIARVRDLPAVRLLDKRG